MMELGPEPKRTMIQWNKMEMNLALRDVSDHRSKQNTTVSLEKSKMFVFFFFLNLML